jgi:hypothetical protein
LAIIWLVDEILVRLTLDCSPLVNTLGATAVSRSVMDLRSMLKKLLYD